MPTGTSATMRPEPVAVAKRHGLLQQVEPQGLVNCSAAGR
jgi:hypothetical protein